MAVNPSGATEVAHGRLEIDILAEQAEMLLSNKDGMEVPLEDRLETELRFICIPIDNCV